MSVFCIGDLHLSFGLGEKGKPMGIFRGWENHVESLVANWNYRVGEEDTCVIIGDVSWASSLAEAAADFRFINDTLQGEKIIIKGNHDYWWATAGKMNAYLRENGFTKIKIISNNAYLAENIAVAGSRGWVNDGTESAESDKKILVREAGRLELSVADAIKKASAAQEKNPGENPEVTAFVHYPPIFGSEENTYILNVLQKYAVKRCFYGHLHGAGGAAKAFEVR
ncbi:ser/threonine protein phosphatase [Clostridia bacterium]|nr:ser/threonine protein phosphatase [Clostridia bacterium]